MSSRWNNKGKNNCTNYNYWCDEYAEAKDKYPYGNGSNW